MSWWLNVPREQWQRAVDAQAGRMLATKMPHITAEDRPTPRKFDQGSTLIVRTRPVERSAD